MGENSHIEWTHHTFNPWRGCTKVSAGCKNCYAETLSSRNPKVLGVWGPKGSRPIAAESYWKLAEKWDSEAEKAGGRRRVFCSSLADVFEGPETMPEDAREEVHLARLRLWCLIEATPNLDWLLLTKRPENVLRPDVGAGLFADGCPPNVWLGTSVEDQKSADERIPLLLNAPVPIRFLSCEPLLGPVDLQYACFNGADSLTTLEGIHWVICGGESGPNARPMHPEWARSLRQQCEAAKVPFLFKQWGEWTPNFETGKGHEETYLDGYFLGRAGKKTAGRVLDGRTWDEFPKSGQVVSA